MTIESTIVSQCENNNSNDRTCSAIYMVWEHVALANSQHMSDSVDSWTPSPHPSPGASYKPRQ